MPNIQVSCSGPDSLAPWWKTMDTAPWGKEVFVMGESGYHAPHDKFIINAYREKDWHHGEWNDATGTKLSDAGWTPLFWSEISHFPDFSLAKI